MENYQYPASYPDSGESSPRSREIDFENPPPWDEQQSQNYKAKFMCSYGGKIQPRTHDNQLSYVGGDTKILAVERSIKFPAFLSKLAAISDAAPQDLTFKYQLPGEDLDALISVTNDDDLEHMMHEYDRLYRPNSKPVRMRLFLFTLSVTNPNPNPSFSTQRDRFVDALNSGPIPSQPDPVKTPPVTPSNVDYLFGLDKAVAPPTLPPNFAAAKFHDPVPEPAAPPLEYQSRASDRVVGSDPNVNSIEIQRQLQQEMQRLQIAENEYRRRSEDGFAGGYAGAGGDYYMQKVPEKVAPANSAPPPATYWSEKHFSGEGYPTTVTTAPGGGDQQVYVIPAPGNFYHQPPVVRPPQAAAQGYYAVQRMGSEGYREQQAVYGGGAPQKAAFTSAGPVKGPAYGDGYGGVVRPAGVPDNAAYAQVAYDSATGRQVYYTAQGGVVHAPPLSQYQGVPPGDVRPVGVSVGQDVKVVNKASQGSV